MGEGTTVEDVDRDARGMFRSVASELLFRGMKAPAMEGTFSEVVKSIEGDTAQGKAPKRPRLPKKARGKGGKGGKSLDKGSAVSVATADGHGGNAETDLVVPCPPVKVRVIYNAFPGFRSFCCPNAFTAGHPCKFAYCPACGDEPEPKKTGRRKRGEGAEGVAVRKESVRTGACPEHTKEDCKHLRWERQDAYRKEKRVGTKGWEDVAEHCVGCGKIM